MGQAESVPASGEATPRTGVAFHVLRVAERSPAAEAGIDPFFDFICGVNGQPLGEDIDTLTDVLERSEGRQIFLQVYSTKRKELRDVKLVPSRSWSSSAASSDGQPSLIGLSLRLCNPQHALEQVWHVLEILEGSPAQSAGLVPFGDWIVGYAGGILRGEGDFYDVVEAHVDKPLRLFVYNADYDVTREAILVPNRSWGGEGLLGCGVGYGLLHRIPKPQDRAARPPEDDDDDDDQEEEQSAPTQTREFIDHRASQQRAYEEDLRSDGRGGYDSRDSRTSSIFSAPPKNGRPRETMRRSDGYDEVPYVHQQVMGEFAASDGVEVVPVQEDEEQDLSGFVSADSFAASAGVMNVPRSSAATYASPPPLTRHLPPTMGYGGRRAGEYSDEDS